MMRSTPSNTPSSRHSPSPKAPGASEATSASSGARGRTGKTARCPDWKQGRACGLQGCHPATPGLPSSPAWALRIPVGQKGRWLIHLLLYLRASGPALRDLTLSLSLPLICVYRVAGEPHPGTNLASRRSHAMVPAQSKSLWLQRVGTVGRGQMSQEGMVECCIL